MLRRCAQTTRSHLRTAAPRITIRAVESAVPHFMEDIMAKGQMRAPKEKKKPKADKDKQKQQSAYKQSQSSGGGKKP